MRMSLVGLVTACLAASTFGQDVRWINPEGGAFSSAENWEGGVVPTLHPPAYGSPARFDLASTYTVTFTNAAFDGVRQVAGNLTFIGTTASTSVGLMEIGTTTGPRVQFNIVGTSFVRRTSSGATDSLMVTVRNADVTTMLGGRPLGSWGTVLIRDNSIITLSTSTPVTGPYVLDVGAGCTLRVNAYQYGETLRSMGTVEATGATLTFNGFNSQGSLTAANSTIYADGFGISGQATLTNCTLTAGGSNMVNLSGQVVLSGPSMRVMSQVACQGSITLRDGAQFVSSCFVPANSRVTVGAGSAVHGVVLTNTAATLAADANATAGPISMWSPAGKLEITFDALHYPATPTLVTDSRLGMLVVLLQNSNALHLGDHIPFIAHPSATTSAYVSPQLPQLPGGRRLQLSYSPTMVFLDVVSGGTLPCWTADFNGDDDSGTDADLEAFFACLAGNCCATCGSADFNADGDIGTDGDIEAFFRVLAGGAC